MPNETPFQIILLLSIVAFLAIRMYYRLRTGTLQLDLSSSKDSGRMKILISILSVLAMGMLIWLIRPGWMRWSALALPE